MVLSYHPHCEGRLFILTIGTDGDRLKEKMFILQTCR
ncbi:MAG: hypothetical protein ACI9WU_003478, partial [Myxococcota bacterium]